MLEEVGLESAVDAYLPVFERRTGIPVHYEKLGEAAEIDGKTSGHVYRVLQEALNNVARHSKSPRAYVRLSMRPSSLILEVEDEGVGFRNQKREGMGLVSMRERAEILHGAIEFREGNHRGALVRLNRAAGMRYRSVGYGRYDSASGATCAFIVPWEDDMHADLSHVNTDLA